MKWCRFQIEQRVSYGVVEDARVTEVIGSPLAEYRVTDTQHLLSEVKLLPPIVPPMLYRPANVSVGSLKPHRASDTACDLLTCTTSDPLTAYVDKHSMSVRSENPCLRGSVVV